MDEQMDRRDSSLARHCWGEARSRGQGVQAVAEGEVSWDTPDFSLPSVPLGPCESISTRGLPETHPSPRWDTEVPPG